jgi:hypothetical protein
MEEMLQSLEKFEKDSKWFAEKYDELKNKYKGKFVLIKDSKVVASGNSMEEIKQKAEKENIDLSESVVEFVPSVEIAIII